MSKDSIKTPIIIDLDGVLRIGDELAEGAEGFFAFIRDNGIPACILSNTTLNPASTISKFFLEKGLDNTGIAILTALDTTVNYVSKNFKTASVYCDEIAKSEFGGIEDDAQPEAVVIGDLGEKWSYEVLNEIFRKVIAGAEIIAMHMSRYWKVPGKGLCLDAGAFIKAIEYASSKTAVVIGKPSPISFQTALKKAGATETEPFYMIGDDLISDIKAAQDAGGKGILVMTGKTDSKTLQASSVKPDYIAEDLSKVITILGDQ